MVTQPRSLRNITITLDADTAAWVRVFAAERGMSVSRIVGDLLYERMGQTRNYGDAMRRFLAHKPFDFEWLEGRPPTRAEIHERAAAPRQAP